GTTRSDILVQLDYPAWLRIEHWLNVLFVTLLIRSGIEILASYPKLHWRNDSRPGTEFAKFTRIEQPEDKLFDTLDEEESYSPLIRSEEHTSELQSRFDLVCRLLLEKKK